jgi:hypothetical protein
MAPERVDRATHLEELTKVAGNHWASLLPPPPRAAFLELVLRERQRRVKECVPVLTLAGWCCMLDGQVGRFVECALALGVVGRGDPIEATRLLVGVAASTLAIYEESFGKESPDVRARVDVDPPTGGT